jgi:hypothetical protein
MKRLIATVLALTLVGGSAAMARGYEGHDRGDYEHSRYGYRNHDGDAAAAVGLGVLALGLFATLASQAHDENYYDAAPPPLPPAPPPAYGYDGYGPGFAYPPPAYGPSYGFSFRFGR